MFWAITFITELFILFLLSRTLTNLLFTFFYRISRSKKISVYLMSLLFFPGTLIHELSHAMSAAFLQVPVGEIELIPKLTGDTLKLGSVQVARTDPFRRFLIGTAPFITGASLIIGIFLYAVQNNLLSNQLFVIVISYLVFEIGNTMFSSKKDMEGALELMLVISILIAIFYFAGLRLPTLNPDVLFGNPLVEQTFQKASLYLAAPVGIDLIIIIMLKLLKFDRS